MRITYISGAQIPSLTANSIHVMKMAQALSQEGHAVELLVPRGTGGLRMPGQDLWHHYGIKTPFSIRWISSPAFPARAYQIRAIWYVRNNRADLVYTRGLDVAAACAVLAIPTICELHDSPGGKFGPFYFRLFLTGQGFRRLVVISQALRDSLAKRYPALLRDKQVIVAPDGVDLERFEGLPDSVQARRQLQLNEGSFTVGYTGHLYAGRGIDLMLQLAHRCPKIQFLIVGGQPDAVAVRVRECLERGLGNVRFTGFVENADLPLYQAACDVLLLPHQKRVAASGGGDISGVCSPMKMFEYMATGRLIIASDLPVLREVLNDHNAVLCNPEDVAAWQSALERAISDPKWRHSLGRQARQDVEQYTWQRRVRKVLAGCCA